ncbi:MAG TPA: tetratricopeptide repeat protein [Streptosporangiaceae bacterium]|jgi:tetratricopeptide (TPR) repeat protein/transcriptional regulator with XRE-family HTH domain|nr:tetratricopeptide repeat protein [Streptosporangiaceae bacterium]
MRPVPEPARTFAALLKQLRTSAGMTQEELARAATLSYRSISDLERGINLTARGQTARLLAEALNLKGAARASFEAAARGAAPTSPGGGATGRLAPGTPWSGGTAAATRTLPRDAGAFTGREPELRVLLAAAAGVTASGQVVGIHAIGGMAGVGKTTFAVHAAHQLAPRFPDGQVFLPLHAHTPGQRPVEPADALASLLLTAGIAAGQIPPGLEERVRLWRDHVAERRLLLVLDDAAGHEQVRPLLPGTAGSLVLITSRKHLVALDDTQTISLDTLPKAQAAELLVRLAGRSDLAPSDELALEIARLCGYLPLAIGMLAKQLQHHPSWTAADLAGELATTRDRLELMRAENVSVSAAFDLSYADLAPDQQRLFRRLGLHQGVEVDAYAAAALDDAELAATRRRLSALYDHYLLTESARGRYRLHDLLREHARALAGQDSAQDREVAAGRLLGYYVHTACAADQHLTRRIPVRPPRALPPPPHAPAFKVRADAIAWLDSERINLNAVRLNAAEHGPLGAAITLAAATHAYLRFSGHWDQALAQDLAAVELAHRADNEQAEAGARTNLGDMLLAMRDYPAATENLTEALKLYHGLDDRLGEAAVRTELAAAQYLAGDNPAAAAGLARAIELYRELDEPHGEAHALSRLASVQLVTGDYTGASDGLSQALELYRPLGDRLGEAHALNELGAVRLAMGDHATAAGRLDQALAVYRELGDQLGAANALSDLAGVRQATGNLDAAVADLAGALDLYRQLGDRLGKANGLNQLGALQLAGGQVAEASASLSEALDLYRDLGDQAGEAESLINLGDLAMAAGDHAEARRCFGEAKVLADGVASVPLIARALEGLGLARLRSGQQAEGTAALTEALELYQRIGSPAAQRARQALRTPGAGEQG